MYDSELYKEAKTVLLQLKNTIHDLTEDEYTQKIELLSHSSIGEHTRHIIELFQQLLTGYKTATVDYDSRKRNPEIQQNVAYAAECLAEIISNLEMSNKPLVLTTVYNQRTTPIESNYSRELMFNIEHCVHHQAIIKIGLLYIGKSITDKNFGVAKSTINYRDNVHS